MNNLLPQSEQDDGDRLDDVRSAAHGEQIDGLLFETIADPILLCRYESDILSSVILEANPGAYTRFGYARDELVGQPLDEIVTPDTDLAARSRPLREGRRISCRAAGLESSGEELPVELHLTLRSLRDAAVLCVVCRDISERKRAGERARRSLEHQSIVTALARRALRADDTSAVLDKTVRHLSHVLDTPYVGLFKSAEEEGRLHLKAGTGWDGQDDCSIPLDPGCELGYTLERGVPVRVSSYREETRFRASDLLVRTRIESSLSTAVKSTGGSPGVLLAASTETDHFRREDAVLLDSVAELLAEILRQRRAKRAVRASETKYRRLFNESRDALFIVAPDGEILTANPAAERMFGYDTWAVNAKDLYVDPEERLRFRHQLEQHGSVRDFEVQMRHRDGTVMHCLMTSTARWNADGQTDAYQTIIRDITSRKAAEEALKASEEKFRTFTEKALVGVYILQNDTFQYVNPRFAEILGYTPGEIIEKKHPRDLVHPEDWEFAERQIRERLAKVKKAANYSFRALTRHGHPVHVEVYGTRIQHEGAPAILGTMIDITERRRLERQILQISEEERRRIGQDLHDGLGQTLTGIGMIAQNLARNLGKHDSPFAPMASEISDLIQEADRRAHDLAHGLTPVDLTTGGLPAALEQLSSRTEQLFGVSCTVECDPSCLLEDTTTATNLYRIAQEAVTNAVKHGNARHIDVRLQTDRDRLQLAVSDDGTGFDGSPRDVKNGMGINLMRYRARIAGGVLEIRERAAGGTELTCRIRTP